MPEPEAILNDNTGANKPSIIEAVSISTFVGPANTIATADKPEIKLKHILQKPKDKNEALQAINGLCSLLILI
jgi:hypothetical protein